MIQCAVRCKISILYCYKGKTKTHEIAFMIMIADPCVDGGVFYSKIHNYWRVLKHVFQRPLNGVHS